MAELLEAVMLICFGLSWPLNAYKNYKAGTAVGTSWQFIALITAGYFAGIDTDRGAALPFHGGGQDHGMGVEAGAKQGMAHASGGAHDAYSNHLVLPLKSKSKEAHLGTSSKCVSPVLTSRACRRIA